MKIILPCHVIKHEAGENIILARRIYFPPWEFLISSWCETLKSSMSAGRKRKGSTYFYDFYFNADRYLTLSTFVWRDSSSLLPLHKVWCSRSIKIEEVHRREEKKNLFPTRFTSPSTSASVSSSRAMKKKMEGKSQLLRNKLN